MTVYGNHSLGPRNLPIPPCAVLPGCCAMFEATMHAAIQQLRFEATTHAAVQRQLPRAHCAFEAFAFRRTRLHEPVVAQIRPPPSPTHPSPLNPAHLLCMHTPLSPNTPSAACLSGLPSPSPSVTVFRLCCTPQPRLCCSLLHFKPSAKAQALAPRGLELAQGVDSAAMSW
jgi:hypothetical protein